MRFSKHFDTKGDKMNVSIVGKQFDLTDAIKDHISAAISSLEKYNLDIISARAVVTADERNGKKGFSVEFVIMLPNKNSVVIKQKDKDVYAAVDLAIDRAQKVLRRHSDKTKEHKAEKLEEIEAQKILEEEKKAFEELADEIIPMELDLYKPTELEEALEKLKESDKQFLVFNDMDNHMRVLYRRGDGKYGLY